METTSQKPVEQSSDIKGIERRAFLGLLAGGAGGLLTRQLLCPLDHILHAQGGNEKTLVILNLAGGNDGLNMVPPLTLPDYFKNRPSLAISPKDAVSLLQGPKGTKEHGLHPSLKQLGSFWNQGELAIVRKVGYPQANRSHFTSARIWSRGYRKDRASQNDSGWIARFLDQHGKGLVPVVGIGTGRRLDFRGGSKRSLIVERIGDFGFDGDSSYRARSRFRNQLLAKIYEKKGIQGSDRLLRETGRKVFGNLSRLEAASKNYRSTVSYPNSSLAKRLREIAVLMKAGIFPQIAYTIHGGFDTHSAQAGRHAGLMATLDSALAAFRQDLITMGAWKKTVVVVISEFGRKNHENGSKGTDHGTGSFVFVLGGQVKGGMHGPQLTPQDLQASTLPYGVDFRDVYEALLTQHLGVKGAGLFPETRSLRSALKLL
jgi:uncharacterized protein (DUF1501 family)